MKTNIIQVGVLMLCLAGFSRRSANAAIPMTGEAVPELTAFDNVMTNFMRVNNIKGGALAVMKDGRLVLKHGYGWSDQAQTIPFDPDSRVRIATVATATAPRSWDTAPQSLPIHLEAGHRYLLEALHKQRITSEHLAIGWELPDGELERPIPGTRIAPFSLEPQPVLQSATITKSGFHFGVSASSSREQVIEASSDLSRWLPIRTNTSGLTLEFEDTDAKSVNHRFYRA